MRNLFEVDGLKMVFEFVNDQLIHKIKVKNTLAGRTYQSNSVELIRVKRDTIVAAFGKKNPDTISYQMNEKTDGEKLCLQLIIQVNLDYLPSFNEIINLQEIQDESSFQDISAQVEELTEMIDGLQKNDQFSLTHKENANLQASEAHIQLMKKQIVSGTYLLQITGVCRSVNGSTTNDTIQFEITYPNGEKEKTKQKTGTNYSYGYPFSLSKMVTTDESGQMRVKAGCLTQYNPLYIERYQISMIPVTVN